MQVAEDEVAELGQSLAHAKQKRDELRGQLTRAERLRDHGELPAYIEARRQVHKEKAND